MVYTISFFISYYFIKIFFAGEGLGKNNFPQKKPFIAVFNHNSNFDMLTLSQVINFVGYGMGKYELFRVPLLGWWLRNIHVHPIIRDAADNDGFEQFVDILNRGHILVVSPEGTRKWTDGQPSRPRTGFIRLAQTFRCPLVPIAIYGTRNILPPGAFFPRWSKIVVRVGKPICLQPVEVKLANRELLQAQANEVMCRVYELLPASARPTTQLLAAESVSNSALVYDYCESA